jgi:hypothetical protein
MTRSRNDSRLTKTRLRCRKCRIRPTPISAGKQTQFPKRNTDIAHPTRNIENAVSAGTAPRLPNEANSDMPGASNPSGARSACRTKPGAFRIAHESSNWMPENFGPIPSNVWLENKPNSRERDPLEAQPGYRTKPIPKMKHPASSVPPDTRSLESVESARRTARLPNKPNSRNGTPDPRPKPPFPHGTFILVKASTRAGYSCRRPSGHSTTTARTPAPSPTPK